MEDSPQQTSNPESPTPTFETTSVPLQKKTNKNLFPLLIFGSVLFLLCACFSLCLVTGGASFIKVFQERRPVEEVIDTFMQTMVARNTEKAFTLFSTRAQRQMEMSDLEDMSQGNNYVLFDGYESIEIGNFNISKAFNTDQNLPQGTVAKVDGTIYYDGGYTGSFQAVLEKENGVWRIYNIHITVPPNKLTPKTMHVQEQ